VPTAHADPAGVALLGGGDSGLVVEDDRSLPEMVLAAVEAALEDAGVGWEAIDATVTASADLLDGLTASNIAVTEVVGAVMRPETRIAADGLAAAVHAAHQIAARAYGTVLVVAHGKASMAPYWQLTAWSMDPVLLQPIGVDHLVASGLQAARIAADDPAAPGRWAETVAARRAAAGGGLTGPVTVEEVLASPVLASPVREAMCAPLGDLAAAVVLTASERARSRRDAVVLTGTGHDLSRHHPPDAHRWTGLERACRRAYATAGIEQPAEGFVVAEPSCLFAHEEELFRAATGLGDATALSPTGGLFAGTAPVVSGLTRLTAAAGAIAGRRGARALAHGAWGPAGQGQAVAVLEAA